MEENNVKVKASNGQLNCVRVQHIVKHVGYGEKVARHFDNVLEQISTRVGPFTYVTIFKTAKVDKPDERDTIGFIQLKNPHNHRELAFMLKEYCFHGKCLDAQLASFEFQSIDDEYKPRPVDCRHCNYYLKDLAVWEASLMKTALRTARKDIIARTVPIKPQQQVRQRCSVSLNIITTTTATQVSPRSSPADPRLSPGSNSSFCVIDEQVEDIGLQNFENKHNVGE